MQSHVVSVLHALAWARAGPYLARFSYEASNPRNYGVIKKGKVVPLRSIEEHLSDRRYSSYSFLTPALEGGEWSASRSGRALPPGKESPVPIVQEAVWAPEPVWTQRVEEKSSASVGYRTPAVQSVVRHYTDWATQLQLWRHCYLYCYWHSYCCSYCYVYYYFCSYGYLRIHFSCNSHCYCYCLLPFAFHLPGRTTLGFYHLRLDRPILRRTETASEGLRYPRG
jgi:hypothetical protein